MKSINQIFKNNPELKDKPEVRELIEYCQEIEGQLFDKKSEQSYSQEDLLLAMLKDIHTACKDELKKDEESIRFKETERVDFKQSVMNLKSFIEQMARDNNIRIW